MFFYQPSKEVIVRWAQFLQQFFLRYYPWLIWPRWLCAANLGWWPFYPLELNRVSVWAVQRLMKSSLQLHFWYHHFFPQVFSMFLSLKATWIMYAKWNESDYKRSLGLKRVGKWTTCPTTHTLLQCKPREVISHFNTLLPLVVTAKSVNVYGLWKRFLPASTQVSNCYC